MGLRPDDKEQSQMSYRRPFRDGTLNFVPYITYTVASASAALSAAFWATGNRDGTFGLVPLEQIWGGDWGGLITPTLLHASPLQNPFHILFNLLWLVRIGPLVERALGRLEYLVFLAFAALVGSGAEIALTSHESVGLSGVVYALWGLCWAARRYVTSFQLVSTRDTTNYMLGWLVLCIVLTYAGSWNVANGAHVGGLLFGVAVGWLFVDRDTAPRFRALGGVFLALLATVTVLSVTYVPWSARWQMWRQTGSGNPAGVTAPQR